MYLEATTQKSHIFLFELKFENEPKSNENAFTQKLFLKSNIIVLIKKEKHDCTFALKGTHKSKNI